MLDGGAQIKGHSGTAGGELIGDNTSATSIRWMLNLWPPFIFQGIRVLEFDPGFRFAVIRVRKSILTRNLMGTTFGGALSAAADPFYPLLYWRKLSTDGVSTNCWIRQQRCEFIRPADATVELRFAIEDQQLATARAGIEKDGRVDLEDVVDALLPAGEVAARFHITTALRARGSGSTPLLDQDSID